MSNENEKLFEEESKFTGTIITSEEQFTDLIHQESKDMKFLKEKFDIDIDDLEVPFNCTVYSSIEKSINNLNKLFDKCHLNYEIKAHEFKRETTFYFINYAKNIMLSGNSLFDIFKPYQLIKLVELIKKSLPVATKDLKGYGVMVRKDFDGNALQGTSKYIGKNTYRGIVKNGYLTDKKGTRHSLTSNYITNFKIFDTEKKMLEFSF